MKSWFLSRNGAVMLSVLTLLSQLWRGFLDAMFVLPSDFGDDSLMQLAAIIFTFVFAGWAWSLWATSRGSYRGLVSAFIINAVILLVVPLSWLLVYCPAACRAEAGIFNVANTLNLALGLIAAVALAVQFRQSSPFAASPRIEAEWPAM